MSSVPPLLTPALPPAASASAVAAEVVVVQATAQMAARVAALRVLEALVVSQQRDGGALLRTDFGMLQVKLPFPVTDGARLALQVGIPGSPATTPPHVGDNGFPALRLASVDGRPVTQAMQAGRMAAPALTGRAAVEVLPPTGTGPELRATMVKPAVPSPTGGPGLLAGSVFPVRLLSVAATTDLPSPAPLSGTSPAAASAAQPATMPASAPPPQAAGPIAQPSPAAQIQAAQATAQAAPPPPAMASTAVLAQSLAQENVQQGAAAPPGMAPQPSTPVLPATLAGTVAPNTLAGQPLVQTPLGLITLQGGPALPPGAQVALQVTGPATLNQAPTPGAAPAAGSWSGLSQALTTLGQSDPAAAARLAGSLPELGPHLASGMVAFVAAARNGVLRPVVGERAAQALEKAGRGDTAKRLMQELESAEPQVQRDSAGGGDWRVMTMPLLNGDVVEPIRLFMRRPEPEPADGEGGAGGGDRGLRFVVDVSLTALGRLQIDGLMRRSMKRLDVLVRTAQPLPGDMRQAIARIFADCCSASGVSGEAGFQVSPRFVEPASEPVPCPTGLLA